MMKNKKQETDENFSLHVAFKRKDEKNMQLLNSSNMRCGGCGSKIF